MTDASQTNWQPIETAPKDGTVILTVCTYDDPPTYELNSWWVHSHDVFDEVADGLYSKRKEESPGMWSNNGHRASYWMLPPPPPEGST